MLLPLGTYLCCLSLRLLHPLGTVSAFAFLCIQRYTDHAAHAMETNIEQNPQRVRWNNGPGAQIPQRFLRLSANLSDSNYQVLLMTVAHALRAMRETMRDVCPKISK